MALFTRAAHRCMDSAKAMKDWATGKLQLCRKHPQQTSAAVFLITVYLAVNYGPRLWAMVVRQAFPPNLQGQALTWTAQLENWIVGRTVYGFFGRVAATIIAVQLGRAALARQAAQQEERRQAELELRNMERVAKARIAMQEKLAETARLAEQQRREEEALTAQQRALQAEQEASRAAAQASNEQGHRSDTAVPPQQQSHAERQAQRYEQMQAQAAAAKKQQEAAAAAAAAGRKAQAQAGTESKAASVPAAEVARQAAEQRAANAAPGASAGIGSSRGTVGSSSSSNMIPLSVAQEAERRQREWLQQLSAQTNPDAARRAALESERRIREQQDAEYLASLEADRVQAAEREARKRAEEQEKARAEEQRREAANRMRALAALKEELRSSLPQEPPTPAAAGAQDESQQQQAPAVIVVRVRLPDGSSHTRRWLAETGLDVVHDWVQSLEAMPLWEPTTWQLALAFPRTPLPRDSGLSLEGAAGGHAHVAMLVERCD